MLSHYYTVKSCETHEIVIQKSRFIASVHRVESESEAHAFIAQIKKQYNDASHNCSAYMIGEHDQIQKANDDGEPNGTAGVPMLEVLKKRELKDTVVVVTRYFGGTKLGAGGLIRAYGRATTEGINAAGIVERKLSQIISAKVDYTLVGKIENELRGSHYRIKDIHYLDQVTFETYIPDDDTDAFEEWMTNLTSGQAAFERGDRVYLEENVK